MAFKPNDLIKMFQHGNPFAGDPADASDYYAAIGRIVVTWGRFEQAIEQAIWMGSIFLPDPASRKAVPTPFKVKLERLKRVCSEPPYRDELLQDVCNFSALAEMLGRKRNALTHANWQGFNKDAAEPTVTFANIQWDSQNGMRSKRSVPLSELHSLLSEIVSLNSHFMQKTFSGIARAAQRTSAKSE